MDELDDQPLTSPFCIPDGCVLAEAASEARAFGAGPAAALDELVHALLGQLADWQQSIGELGRAHHGN